jgi:hypothetical protein
MIFVDNVESNTWHFVAKRLSVSRRGAEAQRREKNENGLLCVFAPLRENNVVECGTQPRLIVIRWAR